MWKLGKYASYGECQYSTHFPSNSGWRLAAAAQQEKKGQQIFLFNPIIIFEYSSRNTSTLSWEMLHWQEKKKKQKELCVWCDRNGTISPHCFFLFSLFCYVFCHKSIIRTPHFFRLLNCDQFQIASQTLVLQVPDPKPIDVKTWKLSKKRSDSWSFISCVMKRFRVDSQDSEKAIENF